MKGKKARTVNNCSYAMRVSEGLQGSIPVAYFIIGGYAASQSLTAHSRDRFA
jgi:hypothetical protein